MHSCETLAAPPASGPSLLLQLGRLIIRARSTSPRARAPQQTPIQRDRLLQAKLLAANPSTSQQVITQPKPEVKKGSNPAVEEQLSDHVKALWNEQIPVCIEVLLAPDCPDCYSNLNVEEEYDKTPVQPRGMLLERWTMRALVNKSHDTPTFSSSQWLLNAVRSQLHFSQLAAWLATLKDTKTEDNPTERRRKLSREKCNFKKLEANCDETELPIEQQRNLNIVYSIKIPGESYNMTEFSQNPTTHQFPITDIGDNVSLKVIMQSLPRVDEIPKVKCSCQKRRPSKDVLPSAHDDLVGKLNDLTIGSRNEGVNYRRLPSFTDDVVDDRMMTPCSENGKHKCSCDDESDKEKAKLDERRLKEIAKCKRRMRKEIRTNESTSSEGDKKETHTSIPILQAARFDRFRAIGCYRNQTYLTLPASRLETKSPFKEAESLPILKRTNTVSTQTDDMQCQCGMLVNLRCDNCRMTRTEGSYDIASMSNGTRRKCEDYPNQLKKHKCDKICDNSVVKRPKLRRVFPLVDRMEKIVSDRQRSDIEELHLKTDDTVFSGPKETKRQKTFSISDDDYVLYEKCDYGTFDKCDLDSPDENQGFKFDREQVPSSSDVDSFRWRFDSATSMVFHTKTGLPLTSSPAPLRRSNNCFDFDDSINGISGIKSALFHPISPASPPVPESPVTPPSCAPIARASTPPPTVKKGETTPKLRIGPSTGLLGSFEESALKGRLEPVATVHGFTAELGASGAFCPPHKRLPVTVFFYAPGGTNAPYMGHINLGRGGYLVSRSGTVQVSLFNPHGTLVKMFVVLYDLRSMPPRTRTFLRQRTLYMPAGAGPVAPDAVHARKWLRYLIHLRFMTSKSGKLYLHTDIRIIVSRKADLDTATAHSALFRPTVTNKSNSDPKSTNQSSDNCNDSKSTNQGLGNGEVKLANGNAENHETSRDSPNLDKCTSENAERNPHRVFGGCGDFDSKFKPEIRELGYENRSDVSYELRSFTYAPENPKYSPR